MIWGSDTAVVNLKTMVGLLLSLFLCRTGIQLVIQVTVEQALIRQYDLYGSRISML